MSVWLWIILILIILLIIFWRQLLAWRKWATAYKKWKDKHCICQAPGDDIEPPEPGWPGEE